MNEISLFDNIDIHDKYLLMNQVKASIPLEFPPSESPSVTIPTVGRIVHYQAYGTPNGEYPSVPRAAIVTQVHPLMSGETMPKVGLAIMNPTGMFFNPCIEYSETNKPGCYSWPQKY